MEDYTKGDAWPEQLNQIPRGNSDAHNSRFMKVEETMRSPRKRRNSEFKMQPQTPKHLATEHQKSALPVSKECA